MQGGEGQGGIRPSFIIQPMFTEHSAALCRLLASSPPFLTGSLHSALSGSSGSRVLTKLGTAGLLGGARCASQKLTGTSALLSSKEIHLPTWARPPGKWHSAHHLRELPGEIINLLEAPA